MDIKETFKKKAPVSFGIIKEMKHDIKRKLKPAVLGELSNIPASTKMGCDRGKAIDRFYIENFLHSNERFIQGDILEIADDEYSKKYSGENSNFHILTYDSTVQRTNNLIYGDLTNQETLISNSFDCFICTQTLNFIYDVKEAIKGIHYVLKDNGVALITVSGLSQISPYDYPRWGDYWRFTDQSLSRLFADVFGENAIQVETYGNLLSSLAFLQGFAVEDIKDETILHERDPFFQCIIGIVAKKRGGI